MALTGSRTFVGFGFGPIQAGLFLHEAFRAGAFRRLVVAHRRAEVVEQIRSAGGVFTINVAHADRVEQAQVGPVTILHTGTAADRTALIQAIAEADEIATAISDVSGYVSEGPGSVHRLLAQGLQRKVEQGHPRAVVYAAENHNRAAQILAETVLAGIPVARRPAVRSRVRFLNTVIGKMSGWVHDPAVLAARSLAPVVPGAGWGFLVEAFNHILIDRVHFDDAPAFRRGIAVFEEKADLRPFEEAKLYGHNATHALAAYVGALAGVERIADLRAVAGMMDFLEAAFVEESGGALVRKYGGVDELFTPAGYRHYAHDLLERMTNPFLHDTVERVGRDPGRKLGWHDRLIGTVRLALAQKITPRRFAFGAAAALLHLDPDLLASPRTAADRLVPLWQGADASAREQGQVLALVEEALTLLRRWQQGGRPSLMRFFQNDGTIT